MLCHSLMNWPYEYKFYNHISCDVVKMFTVLNGVHADVEVVVVVMKFFPHSASPRSPYTETVLQENWIENLVISAFGYLYCLFTKSYHYTNTAAVMSTASAVFHSSCLIKY